MVEVDGVIEICNIKTTCLEYPYDFYIDRRSPLGNPFHMQNESQRDFVCDRYEQYFNDMIKCKSHEFIGTLDLMMRQYKIHNKLRLFCWCAPKRCHGETIKNFIENEDRSFFF